MSAIQKIQTLWLIAQKYALQEQLFQNNDNYLAALRTPMNLEVAHNLDLQAALTNIRISAQLAAIKQQEKILGKNLNTLA